LKAYEDHIHGQVESLDQMVKERTRELEAAQREIVWRLAKACEYRDDETGGHVSRVATYSRILAQGLGQQEAFLDVIFLASALHDVGKIGIPDSILLKEGALTQAEREIVERHAEIGEGILSEAPKSLAVFGLKGLNHVFPASPEKRHDLLALASLIARNHHEKWDGTGYPDRLSGDEIPLECRIVALADVYDALRSARPYKPAFTPEKALAAVQEGTGRHFDPEIVEVFVEHVDDIREVGAHFAKAQAVQPAEVCHEEAALCR